MFVRRRSKIYVYNTYETTHDEDWPLPQLEGHTISWFIFSCLGRLLLCCQSPLHTRPKFSQPSSRFALVYQLVCSRTTADRLYYDWIAEKIGREYAGCTECLVRREK